jgi:thioredoxin 1
MIENTLMNKSEIEQLNGLAIIEFGANWCTYCQAAQAIITKALLNYPNTKHIKIEDGKGQKLGRQYAVKLWPTLVFLKDGVELSRLVRPNSEQVISDALNQISNET